MSLRILCPHCSHGLRASAKMLGRKGRCASCGSSFVISEDLADRPPTPVADGSGADDSDAGANEAETRPTSIAFAGSESVPPAVGGSIVRLALSRPVVMRAAVCAIVVGSVLTIINHGDCILTGNFNSAHCNCLAKSLVTTVVPYLVSTWSSVQALVQQ